MNAQGNNPYAPQLLLPVEKAAGRDTDEAIMMWNPPWTLALAMPFGLLDSRVAQLMWVGLGFLIIAFSADMLWRLYDGPVHFRWVAWLLAFTFLPTFFVLAAGQIGTWVLLGAVLFLFFQGRGWSMLAGASTVLLAIKPHLVYLFWIALIYWGVRRDRRLILGGLLAGMAATAIALACNPDVLQQYWYAMTQLTPIKWQSPTVGTLLRMAGGEQIFGLTFLPTAIGIAWWIARSARRINSPWSWLKELPILFLVSFATASYGAWPFDLIILLPAVIQVAARIANSRSPQTVRAASIVWVAINLPALLLNVFKIGSFWFIWMAPLMLLSYVVLQVMMDREERSGRC